MGTLIEVTMKKAKTISILFLAAVAGLSLHGCGSNESGQSDIELARVRGGEAETQNRPVVADPNYPEAPGFALEDLSGNTVRLSDFKGKMVILNFWATWCGPCRMEIPSFVDLQDEFGDKGLAIVGISLDNAGVSVVKEFVDEFSVNYPILMHDGRVAYQYGINPIPTTFIINKDGKVVNMFIGYKPEDVFRGEIKRWLPGSV